MLEALAVCEDAEPRSVRRRQGCVGCFETGSLALGLGLFAMLAMGAFGVMNATAETGGHFISEEGTVEVHGQSSGTHLVELTALGGEVVCEETYKGEAHPPTQTEINIYPEYDNCETKGAENPGEVEVTENSCFYNFKVGTEPTTVDQTVSLECTEPGDVIEVHHPDCKFTFHEQTVEGGAVYHNVEGEPGHEEGKHAITAEITVTADVTRHGTCQIFGTNGHGQLHGSALLTGFDEKGNQTSITATG